MARIGQPAGVQPPVSKLATPTLAALLAATVRRWSGAVDSKYPLSRCFQLNSLVNVNIADSSIAFTQTVSPTRRHCFTTARSIASPRRWHWPTRSSRTCLDRTKWPPLWLKFSEKTRRSWIVVSRRSWLSSGVLTWTQLVKVALQRLELDAPPSASPRLERRQAGLRRPRGLRIHPLRESADVKSRKCDTANAKSWLAALIRRLFHTHSSCHWMARD